MRCVVRKLERAMLSSALVSVITDLDAELDGLTGQQRIAIADRRTCEQIEDLRSARRLLRRLFEGELLR